MYVYVVTKYNNKNEPIITVFNNRTNANKYKEYAKERGYKVIIDRAPVITKFIIE